MTIALVIGDAGDGPDHDVAIWQDPRIVAAGRPDLPLRDLRRAAAELDDRRTRLLARTAAYLAAAASAADPGGVSVATLAAARGLDPDALRAWFGLLGVNSTDPWVPTGHFTQKLTNSGGHAFINGWGRAELPQLLANSSDQTVRIPGIMKPHGVAVHPSPTLRAVVGWQSPVAAAVRVAGSVAHAHPECGNGVTWTLELRRGSGRTRLASGVAQGINQVAFGPVDGLSVRPGDGLTLAIGPRDGNHACDLTALDLRVTEVGGSGRTWDLAADVAGDILAGNPHADQLGHPVVWHFLDEPDRAEAAGSPRMPEGSTLSRWQAERDPAERGRLADAVAHLLVADRPPAKDGPDATLHRLLRSAGGPLLGTVLRARPLALDGPGVDARPSGETAWGLDPSAFGRHPGGRGDAVAPTSLCVAAPAALTVRIPADLAEGAELVATGMLAPGVGAEGSVQLDVAAGVPFGAPGLQAGGVTSTPSGATWTATAMRTSFATPILAGEGTAVRRRIEAAFDDFRALFPAALCYSQVVPVDEVVTLTLFHREDGPLVRLMLDDTQRARLDRLWDELHFVGRDALTLVDAFAQLLEYASQDADPKVFEPLRQPILDRAEAFRRRLVDAEPRQVDALVAFGARAYRRPLTGAETDQIRGLYARLRSESIPHDEAFRLTLARILVAPAFLYKLERPGLGAGQKPVTTHELATRLAYFLGSSPPDAELRSQADSGRLADPAIVRDQARRLVVDGRRARRLAVEFAAHWLQISDLADLDEKSERHFPTFLGLRGAMAEESTRFLADLFASDGSVLAILDGDYTFLNAPLAAHYGIPLDPAGPTSPDGWRRVEGVKRYGRGGILGQASMLARQSGASRTSPTLRGNWISEVLLGERLPRPPKGVPQLPDDEGATAGLTVRQLVERHAADPKCITCHARIDPLGMALERFDAIGRLRDRDRGDRPVDARARLLEGAEFAGLEGLRGYLTTARREAFVKQFCRKLLGFALGRATDLADEPLLAEMQAALRANDHRVGAAIDAIVLSRQFREVRGQDAADVD